MFYDLNIHNIQDSSSSSNSDYSSKCISVASSLGIQVIAFNTVIYPKTAGKSSTHNQAQPIPITSELSLECKELDRLPRECLRHPKKVRIFSRVTVVVDDISHNHGLTASSANFPSFDIVSVQPTSEKAFQAACSTFDVDLITLDLSSRLPFRLKHSTVGSAIDRGVHFEISFGSCLRDGSARRNFIGNAATLVNVTRGRNLVLTSGAMKALELRGPSDAINLCTLFGMNPSEGKKLVTTNARAVLFHAETRKNTERSVVSVIGIDELQPESQWKVSKKQKLEVSCVEVKE